MYRKLIVAISFFALSFEWNMAQASNLPDYPFIFQSGTARVDVAPDIAVIEVTVSSRGLDAAKTLGVVDASVDDIFHAFIKAKIAQSDITSSDITRSFDQMEKRDTAPISIVSRNIKVSLRDITVWAPLMSQLGGMKNVIRLETEFHTSARSTLEAELELKAAKDAEVKAARIAQSFGRKIVAVMAISEMPFNLLDYKLTSSETRDYYPAPYIPPSGSISAIRAPANISLQKSLNVLFKLE